MFQLTVKSGMASGTSWPISAQPLRIGRESTCDVRIPETVVSRQHCEILLMDGSVRLRHLGGVNPTFVNSLPTRECLLEVGDEIRVGHVVFFITGVGNEAPANRKDHASTDTLVEEDSVYLSAPAGRAASEVHLGRDDDLTELFHTSRSLSRVTTHKGLTGALGDFLQSRFHPDQAWLLLVNPSQPGKDLIPLIPGGPPANGKTGHEIRTLLEKNIKERRGVLIPERRFEAGQDAMKCAMAAPVYMGEHEIGAFLLMKTQPERAYYKQDLHYFVALAHIVAPFFRAIERVEQLEAENQRLRMAAEHGARLIGGSKAMAQVQRMARMVAPSMQPVLILGPTGTGKELVANLIHDLSDRRDAPLITVNCAAIPRELFESEFFGHEKGAFTGAAGRKAGLLEQSDGGTLFLDEIGDLSLEHQARILRAVETGRFRRVGGGEEITADFRVVSATNKELVGEIAAGRFREDLYHRLRAVEIRIPPLNQRRGDIPELAQHFLQAAGIKNQSPPRRLSPKAVEYLAGLAWPGNIRELKNLMDVVNTLCANEVVEVEDIRALASVRDTDEAPMPLEEVERRHILKTMEHANGNMVETARLLGIGRSTLYNKITQYGLKNEADPTGKATAHGNPL